MLIGWNLGSISPKKAQKKHGNRRGSHRRQPRDLGETLWWFSMGIWCFFDKKLGFFVGMKNWDLLGMYLGFGFGISFGYSCCFFCVVATSPKIAICLVFNAVKPNTSPSPIFQKLASINHPKLEVVMEFTCVYPMFLFDFWWDNGKPKSSAFSNLKKQNETNVSPVVAPCFQESPVVLETISSCPWSMAMGHGVSRSQSESVTQFRGNYWHQLTEKQAHLPSGKLT